MRKYLTKSSLERWATGCAYAIIQANKKKGGLCWQQKACPKVKLHGLICLSKILNSSPKLILIYLTEFTLFTLFSLYFLRQILTAATFCYLMYVTSIITQWSFCKYVLLKKIKTGIFNKTAFAKRKLIAVI